MFGYFRDVRGRPTNQVAQLLWRSVQESKNSTARVWCNVFIRHHGPLYAVVLRLFLAITTNFGMVRGDPSTLTKSPFTKRVNDVQWHAIQVCRNTNHSTSTDGLLYAHAKTYFGQNGAPERKWNSLAGRNSRTTRIVLHSVE